MSASAMFSISPAPNTGVGIAEDHVVQLLHASSKFGCGMVQLGASGPARDGEHVVHAAVRSHEWRSIRIHHERKPRLAHRPIRRS